MERRSFIKNIGTAALGMSILESSFANNLNLGASGKIVVIGGGMAGTTVAKFLRLWGGTGMDVTLVEPNATYYSNIFSNMVLTGEKTLSQLSYNYSNLTSKFGVKVQNFSASLIDPVNKTVTLSSGTKLIYDRLVLAPGIDFESLPISGTSANQAKIVNAWKAGVQTTSL